VLATLEITPDEVSAVVNDERYLGDVLHWLERSSAFVAAQNGLKPRPALARLVGSGDPDLVVIKDDAMAEIRGSGLDEIKETLKASGWLVMRPD
jgi:hypothetical protein